VFHLGEDFYWLEKMLAEGCKYVGVGGIVGVPPARRREWLDQVFLHLCGSAGYPAVKVHGFGATSWDVVARYPWTTVDSMSWIRSASYGRIIVPKSLPDGGYDFRSPLIVAMSHDNSAHKDGDSYWSMRGETRAYVRRFIKSLGFGPKRLARKWPARVEFNLRVYEAMSNARKLTPLSCYRPPGFFGSELARHGRATPVVDTFHFIAAVTVGDNKFVQALENAKYRYALFSYHYFMRMKPDKRERLFRYIATGSLSTKRKELKTP